MALRRFAPVILVALGLVATVALPWAAYLFTEPRNGMPGFDLALRAHVAWARIAGVGLMVAAAVSLARLHERDARSAGRQGAAILCALAALAIAASFPAYDQWVDARMEARYVDAAPGWEVAPSSWRPGPEGREFTYQLREANHTGAVEVPMPDLAKGDFYRAFVAYQAGEVMPFYKSEVSTSTWDACMSWEMQMPRGRPTDPDPQPMASGFIRECTASGRGSGPLVAQWGADEPVDTYVGIVLRPTYGSVVAARADDSVMLVSILGALAVFVALGLAARRGPSADSVSPLATGIALACAAWAVAPWVPRARFDMMAQGPAIVFTVVAALSAACALALPVARKRGIVAPGVALRGAMIAGGVVLAAAPMAAGQLWRFDVPWVVLGMLGTLVLLALALAVADRLGRAPSAD